jgi:hypothetical protein
VRCNAPRTTTTTTTDSLPSGLRRWNLINQSLLGLHPPLCHKFCLIAIPSWRAYVYIIALLSPSSSSQILCSTLDFPVYDCLYLYMFYCCCYKRISYPDPSILSSLSWYQRCFHFLSHMPPGNACSYRLLVHTTNSTAQSPQQSTASIIFCSLINPIKLGSTWRK